MQPYFFPYIGYFKLINEVDTFVFYNDVDFRKNSWIHRNRIISCSSNNIPTYFGLRLHNPSSNTKIKDVYVNHEKIWKRKILNKIKFSYSESVNYETIFALFTKCINRNSKSLSEININSVVEVCEYLKMKNQIFIESSKFGNSKLKGENRVIDICKALNASSYINLIGGKNLYSRELFSDHGIELSFLETIDSNICNFDMSILHLLFNNHIQDISTFLKLFKIQ